MTTREGAPGDADHHPSVLVTAASRHGATTEIAEAIGRELAGHGISATVAQPDEVTGVENYDAVILGSAVYSGHWLGPARDLVARAGGGLASRPVWLFSSGPVGDPRGRLTRSMGRDPVDLGPIAEATRARDHHMFAGKLDPKALSLPQRAALAVVRGLRGDFRDWAEIRRWADGIARQLT